MGRSQKGEGVSTYVPEWCKYPETHVAHEKIDSARSCKRCRRPINWALEHCFDCDKAIREEGRTVRVAYSRALALRPA